MAIVIHRDNQFKPDNDQIVKLKHMGNIEEISFIQKRNKFCPIILIDKDHYCKIDFDTGEISEAYECNHIKNRSENVFQVGQSLKRLRDLINTNVVRPNEWKWITLTYKENMTDTKKLMKDFEKFYKRLQYKFSEFNFDYIVACEPQGRGAWHMHLLLWFHKVAPFIDNETIWKLWSPKGYEFKEDFVKTKALNEIDNLGAYLTAYLGDMELNEETIQLLSKESPTMLKDVIKYNKGIKELNDKKFIKGARLYMYPPKFNIYRCSRGIQKPTYEELEYFDAKIKVGYMKKPTYTSCLYLEDIDSKYNNTIYYEYYNKIRK